MSPFKLTDIDVLRVGLVKRGAQGEEFLLMKSEDGEPESVEDVLDTKDLGDEDSGFWKKMVTTITGALGSLFSPTKKDMSSAAIQACQVALTVLQSVEAELPDMAKKAAIMLYGVLGEEAQARTQEQPAPASTAAPAATPAANQGGGVKMEDKVEKTPPAAETVVAEKVEVTPTAETAAPAAAEAVVETEVTKAQKEAETAKAALEKAQDENRRLQWLQKAQEFKNLPVGAEELASGLAKLEKSDSGLCEWLVALLKAVDNRVTDQTLFKEAGTAAVAEGSIVAKAESMVRDGKAKTLKEALLSLPKEEQEAYVQEMRQKVKGGK